ncbi:AMIN domain-containing protein [Nostoc sp. CENA67]|uniref:AMIN domain-containing protein n=1 Tax=Amazonocrinis nigriterrae CENA67 TaxID=2794033 RepID=A0A8J7HM73_9NOST|nr:AMIN domain-containing protein [Amazonocrinis nigriterrae]MBH8562042.1 AMIN domain-containing protein [Amazonocrinis nigriterrae CENA67]
MSKRLTTRQLSQWSQQLFSVSLFGLYTVVMLETATSAVKPVPKKSTGQNHQTVQLPNGKNTAQPIARLDDWRFYPEALQLEITLSAGITPKYFYLSQPPRIVVDLPKTKLGYVPTNQNYSGAIKGIRVSQLNAGVTRIVLDLATGTFVDPNQIQLQPVSKQNPTRWVLRAFNSNYGRSSIQPGLQPAPNNLPPNPNNYYPQPSNTLPPTPNYSQPNISPSNYLQFPSTLAPTTNQQPFVTVPPLTPNNSSQVPSSLLPPPSFPNQPSNLNSTPSVASPNFPTPTVPTINHDYSTPNQPNVEVIEFGQPLPQRRY